jgi:hypothetical protein
VVCFVFWAVDSDRNIGIAVAVIVGLHCSWMTYYCLVSSKFLVFDADEKHAVIATLTLEKILRTAHGFDYLEQHCLQEHNPESIYCLREARELLASDELSLDAFKAFCDKYIYENSDMQVSRSSTDCTLEFILRSILYCR